MVLSRVEMATVSRRKTTRGWETARTVAWTGSSQWIKLKDIKDSYPVQVAEYAVTNRIAAEPAFNWWVQDILRKRNRIVSKVKTKYWKNDAQVRGTGAEDRGGLLHGLRHQRRMV